jgi:uncharacterized integral membrane protein
MFRKIVTAVIVVPLAAVIVAFAVANRQTVTVSFDPFSAASPAATLPLFAVIFAVLIFGVLVGGIAAWLRQGKWRRTARRLDGEVRTLHQEMDAVRRRYGTTEKPPAYPEPGPLAVIPPPMP